MWKTAWRCLSVSLRGCGVAASASKRHRGERGTTGSDRAKESGSGEGMGEYVWSGASNNARKGPCGGAGWTWGEITLLLSKKTKDDPEPQLPRPPDCPSSSIEFDPLFVSQLITPFADSTFLCFFSACLSSYSQKHTVCTSSYHFMHTSSLLLASLAMRLLLFR